MTATPPLHPAPRGPGPTDSGFVPSASIPDAPWFCVYTKPQQERATEHRIRTEGAAVWLPLEAPKKARKSDPEPLIRPVFSRYLFVQAYPWTVVRNAGGEEMARLITSPTTGEPLALPPGAIERLLIQCAPNGVIYPPEPREVTHRDMVRIEDGPFTGFTGICQRTTRERIWILLSLFGRQSEVPFTRKQVELIA